VAVSGLAAMVAALYEVPRAAGGTDPACAAWKDCDLRFARDPWLWFIPLLDCKKSFFENQTSAVLAPTRPPRACCGACPGSIARLQRWLQE
jgi:hypothetical protein